MRKNFLILIVLLTLIPISGCLLNSEKPSSTAQPSPTPTLSISKETLPTVYIEIKGSAFNPEKLTIARGTTVQWTNSDSATYNITGKDFYSGELEKGDSWSKQFNETGNYSYYCSKHTYIKGEIVVK